MNPLTVTCCNGGVPLANWTLGPGGAPLAFETVSLPVQSIMDSSEYNRILNNATGFFGAGTKVDDNCSNFLVRLTSEALEKQFWNNQASLYCQCPVGFEGSKCDRLASAQTDGSQSHSFKIFLYLAIIPLTFGLLAAVGGFMCRLCCCNCFECTCRRCCRKKRADDDRSDSSNSLFEEYVQSAYNRNVEADQAKRLTTTATRHPRQNRQYRCGAYSQLGVCPPPEEKQPPPLSRCTTESEGVARLLPSAPPLASLELVNQHISREIPEVGPPPPYDPETDLVAGEPDCCPVYTSFDEVPQDASTQTSFIVTVVPKELTIKDGTDTTV